MAKQRHKKGHNVVLNEELSEQLDLLLIGYIESAFAKLRKSYTKNEYWRCFNAQPEGTQSILATTLLESQVSNGGLSQYFSNVKDSASYEHARAGLERIGAE